MSYTVELSDSFLGKPKIAVVGCGGTGSFVAEGMCRLPNNNLELVLIDHDRVEPRNLRRQNFFTEDLGKFKSQALAERLARHYSRPVGYSVCHYDRELLNERWQHLGRRMMKTIVIGCVDNAIARQAIAKGLEWQDWWLDAGNSYHSGQVLFGNTTSIDSLEGSLKEKMVDTLPAPSLQLPSLLLPTKRELSCAEALEAEEQSPIINQMMATMVLEFMDRLLKGTLTWMGAYVDLEAGTLRVVPINPQTVAEITGLPVKKIKEGGRTYGE